MNLTSFAAQLNLATPYRGGHRRELFHARGASDDLASGRSTFMVEMTETANILNNATSNSLVLLDEIGRGTSTYDGLSIAWACAEHLAQTVRAFTLFATHYFELTQLPQRHDNIANVHLDATEHKDSIVFLHTVNEGPANQSYGIQVAQLAGLPPEVVGCAKTKLRELESATPSARTENQHDLFDAESPLHPALNMLNDVQPDELSPRDALGVLFRLKALSESET